MSLTRRMGQALEKYIFHSYYEPQKFLQDNKTVNTVVKLKINQGHRSETYVPTSNNISLQQ